MLFTPRINLELNIIKMEADLRNDPEPLFPEEVFITAI